MPHARPLGRTDESAVLAKALLRAADHLGLTARLVAAAIGVSEATVSRLRKGEMALDAGSKPFEMAVLLVRLFRSLDAISGGDDAVSRAWMKNHNIALGGTPADRIRTITGLIDVIAYLDARRALV